METENKFEENRLKLQKLLEQITKNVYFQPPPNIEMKYPAIIYKLDGLKTDNADNIKYIKNYNYLITLVDYYPNSNMFDKINNLSFVRFVRGYSSNNLFHYVFTIYIN